MLAGIVAAVALTIAPSAAAWDWHSLPSGYGVSSFQTVCHIATDPCVGGEGSTCNHVTVTAGNQQKAETDCVNPTFQGDIDAFVDSTICQVNPAAGGSACVTTTSTTVPAPPPPDTTATVTIAGPAAPAPTTSTATTTTQATTTLAAPVAPAATEPTRTPSVTVTVEKDLGTALTLLQQRLDVLEARVKAVEDKLHEIIGEPKNEPPFTEPT